MKKNLSFLLGTLVLAGAVVACNRENPDNNPLYNSDTKEVVTQFVISVNTGGNSGTKQNADVVQQNHNFRGIQNGNIMLFKSFDGDTPYKAVVDPEQAPDKAFTFGSLYSQGQISNAGTNNQDNSSNRILQLSLPVGVNTALIYGKAVNDAPGKLYGKVSSTVAETKPSDIHFNLSRRMGDNASDVTAYDQTEALMARCINIILGSRVPAITGTDPDSGEPYVDDYGYSGQPALSWQQLGAQYKTDYVGNANPGSLEALEEIIGRSYYDFTNIKDGEYRAGCSAAVLRMIKDMYTVMTNSAQAIPSSKKEANAMRLLARINSNTNLFYSKDSEGNWTYLGKSAIQQNMVERGIYASDAAFNTEFGQAKSLNDFPIADFHIPVGAAQLAFDASKEIVAAEKDYLAIHYLRPNKALLTIGGGFNPQRYAYPVELLYYVNSPLLTSNSETLQFPNGATPWETEAQWTAKSWNYANGVVSSSTRGVAVKDNIHYGVALLKSSVALSGGPYADNRHAITGEDNNSFSSLNLELTGVLIGGQNGEMGWQYIRRNEGAHPNDGTNGQNVDDLKYFNWVIYDDAVADAHVPSEGFNYTLVFDNYDSSLGDTQADVNVALEFKNNGEVFYGEKNAIPNNGIFYLIGALKPANLKSGSTIDWTSIGNFQVPPVWLKGETPTGGATLGESKKIPRVFIQGFQTVAKFTIGAESLKHAYYTIPDLRSAQMSLGLSVDLQWKTGFEYNVTL